MTNCFCRREKHSCGFPVHLNLLQRLMWFDQYLTKLFNIVVETFFHFLFLSRNVNTNWTTSISQEKLVRTFYIVYNFAVSFDGFASCFFGAEIFLSFVRSTLYLSLSVSFSFSFCFSLNSHSLSNSLRDVSMFVTLHNNIASVSLSDTHTYSQTVRQSLCLSLIRIFSLLNLSFSEAHNYHTRMQGICPLV